MEALQAGANGDNWTNTVTTIKPFRLSEGVQRKEKKRVEIPHETKGPVKRNLAKGTPRRQPGSQGTQPGPKDMENDKRRARRASMEPLERVANKGEASSYGQLERFKAATKMARRAGKSAASPGKETLQSTSRANEKKETMADREAARAAKAQAAMTVMSTGSVDGAKAEGHTKCQVKKGSGQAKSGVATNAGMVKKRRAEQNSMRDELMTSEPKKKEAPPGLPLEWKNTLDEVSNTPQSYEEMKVPTDT